jgi:cyanophycinase
MKYFLMSLFIIISMLCVSCAHDSRSSIDESHSYVAPKGTLFIIGGGNRPDSMIERIITETGIRDSGYAFVLTMSGFDPDTSAYYGKRQFRDRVFPTFVRMILRG